MAYKHFCTAARALDLVGDRWTLLIVRDLGAGPKRFTDLQQLLSRVSPRQLTLRLRAMERDGLLTRTEGRRDVRYALTSRGRDLLPVVRALAVWGAKHAMAPPLPDEEVHPRHLMNGAAVVLQQRGVRPQGPVRWAFHFPGRTSLALEWDGRRWAVGTEVDGAEVEVTAAPRALARGMLDPAALLSMLGTQIEVAGEPAGVAVLMGAVGGVA